MERCYLVRTVEMIGTLGVESAWSVPACIKPADVFPPAVPKSLAAVASEGAISLIWEGSEEPDLAGYVVLRGIVPGPPAERLTTAPIRETTFRDTTVKPGTRYVYAVDLDRHGEAAERQRPVEPGPGDGALTVDR